MKKKKRKKLAFTILILDSDIKVRKKAAPPLKKFRDKTKYNRNGSKSFTKDLDPSFLPTAGRVNCFVKSITKS